MKRKIATALLVTSVGSNAVLPSLNNKAFAEELEGSNIIEISIMNSNENDVDIIKEDNEEIVEKDINETEVVDEKIDEEVVSEKTELKDELVKSSNEIQSTNENVKASSSNFNLLDWSYTENSDNSITLTKYSGSNTELVIPAETADGKQIKIKDSNKTSTIFNNSVTSVKFESVNGKKVIAEADMSYMFLNCQKLSSVDLSGLDTSSVTDMSYMFKGCSSLSSVDLSGLDTSSVTNMSYMFYGCSSLSSIDLSGLDTSSVTDMNSMFSGCSVLSSVDLSGLDTSSVIDMSFMFYGCSSLSSIDLSGLDTSSVTDMSYMFKGCSSLSSVDLSGLDTSSVTNMSHMFMECSVLSSVDLSGLDTSSVTDMSFMFGLCSSLSSVDLSGLDTSSVTDMHSMFMECSVLSSVDLSGLDTSSVTDMSFMFYGCSVLSSVDLSGLDTSSVTDMSYMFYNCQKLSSVDLSGLDTSSVTDMRFMFCNCSVLSSVDLSGLDTSSVIDMSYMFYGCSSLSSIDLSGLDTSSVIDMRYMFSNCIVLSSVDLSGLDTSSVIDMSSMFYRCNDLSSIDLSGWDTRSVTNMKSMFYASSRKTLLVITSDEKLKKYNYAGDNRVGNWLEFNSNKGSFEDNSNQKKIEFDIVVESLEQFQTLVESEFENMEIPTREGYKFVGWSLSNEDGTNIKAGDLDTLAQQLNKVYYAKWTMNSVIINEVPTITASDKVLKEGDKFDPLEGVTAYDKEDGEIILTEANIVKNTVDTSQVGTYEVTYKVTDSQGASTLKTIIVLVNPKQTEINEVPTIGAEDKVLTVGDKFNPLEGVTAYDKEDGEIILTEANIISNNVDMSQAGVYQVTYKVTDSKGASITKTINVIVKENIEDVKPGEGGSTNDLTNENPKTGDVGILPSLGTAILSMAVLLGIRRKND